MYKNTHTNNFDFLRVSLAIFVMIAHLVILTNSSSFAEVVDIFDNMAELAVDAFFIVSGFLIFMSFERSSSIKSYAIKRVQRIYPAYITVVLVTAFVLFSISNKSIDQYFSIEWIKYLLSNASFLNFLHNWLPGVFENNALQAVNGALWTIKIEVMFYISVPLISIFILRRSRFKGLIAVYLFSVIYSITCFYLAQDNDKSIYMLLQRQLPGQLAFFISGAFLYYYFEEFKENIFIYLTLALFGIFISSFFKYSFIFPISFAVVVIYFATILKYLGNWGKHGDFSYGIYIWHFPIIQTFITLGWFKSSPILAVIGSVFTVFIFAYISWNFVEKPFLRKKSHYKAVEEEV
jgi:peptidoglycan/LPS O-acetylase OafA/YrhL